MAKQAMPQAVYEAVFARSEWDAVGQACEAMIRGVCSLSPTHWHHRKLRSQGGKHEVVNGLAVCEPCHRYFHANPAEAMEKGWIVKSAADPAEQPVLRQGAWARLLPGGEIEEVKRNEF